MPGNAEYHKQRRNKIRKSFIEYKKTLACSHCGLRDYRVLDFHHVKEKKMGVHRMVGSAMNLDKIMEEVAKCIPLCSNCHRIVHWKD